MKLYKMSAKQMESAGYAGSRGGAIRGAFYGIQEDGKGLVSLDGKTPFLIGGRIGKEAMESIIVTGFCDEVKYIAI